MNLSYGLQLQNEAYTARLYERAPKITDTDFDGLIKTTRHSSVATSAIGGMRGGAVLCGRAL
jgi:hypothetical protein